MSKEKIPNPFPVPRSPFPKVIMRAYFIPKSLNNLVGEVLEMAKQFSDRQIIFKIFQNEKLIKSIISTKNDLTLGGIRSFKASNNLSSENSFNEEENEEEIEIEVIADANRLKQVLLNLIDNAVKYSTPSSSVTVALNKIGDWGIIEVGDRGRGIPLSQQSRIFEQFYRIDESRNRTAGGAGLGLSIVKSLVEKMGGIDTLRSKETQILKQSRNELLKALSKRLYLVDSS